MTVSALELDNFDNSISPCDDLFRHANGAWLDRTEIPPDYGSWGAFHVLHELSEKRVNEIITQQDGEKGSESKKIADLYASFMNVKKIAELGIKPITDLVAKVDEITNIKQLCQYFGWAIRYGLDAPFDWDPDADPGNPKRYIMMIGQGGISLPDEEYYRLDQHAKIRESFLSHVQKMFELCGIDPAQAQLVVDLETQIASFHWDKVRTRDLVEMYCLQTWDEFVAQMPQFDQEAFLAGAKVPREVLAEVVNAQRTFPANLNSLLDESHLASWRAWCRWHIIDSLASFGPDSLVEQNHDFYGRTLNGIPQLKPRFKRATMMVQSAMGEAVGKIYVQQFFPPETKARADELVANLLEAYRRSISELDWMSEATRQEALTKLDKFVPKIGYPNKWRDYSKLAISGDGLVANVLNINSFSLDWDIEQLSKPVDPDEWLMYPQTVNAYYHPLRNEIVFPAAILQPPFFNPDADDAVNYGGIGAVIGHEIGHGFDDAGSTCDGDGKLRDWWQDADRIAFKERTSALVNQYNELHPSQAPEVHVNGELTLGENIGDLGGLSIAYLAWLIATGQDDGKPAPEPIDGLTGVQRFFLGFAQVWAGKSRPESMREQVATDPHSPAEFRCNQTVRNVPAFHDAFGVKYGDKMWLAPEQRVKIW